jgi:hypothetical protein
MIRQLAIPECCGLKRQMTGSWLKLGGLHDFFCPSPPNKNPSHTICLLAMLPMVAHVRVRDALHLFNA